jgi:hypothetical protein
MLHCVHLPLGSLSGCCHHPSDSYDPWWCAINRLIWFGLGLGLHYRKLRGFDKDCKSITNVMVVGERQRHAYLLSICSELDTVAVVL